MGVVWIFYFSLLSPDVGETARYKLKYCLKGLKPKTTNQQTLLNYSVGIEIGEQASQTKKTRTVKFKDIKPNHIVY